MTVADQLAQLQSRGMEVGDPTAAAWTLESIGYYRLSGYWYPYRLPNPGPGSGPRLDQFHSDLALETVLRLYDFDRKLKLLVLEASERVEVLARNQIALQLGQHGALAHRDPANFDSKFTKPQGSAPSKYQRWLGKLDEAQQRSREDFVKHHNEKYGGQLPVWVASELLDFGGTSHVFAGLRYSDRLQIAERLGLTGSGAPKSLGNWLHALSYVRNLCAHHSRLWNNNMTRQLSPSGLTSVYALRHLAEPPSSQLTRVFGALCVLGHLVLVLDENADWAVRVRDLIVTDLPPCGRSSREMGFPEGWESLPLWR